MVWTESRYSLLMGRQPKSTLPQINTHLTPDWPHLISFPENDSKFKEKQSQYYNNRHRSSPLSGQTVRGYTPSGLRPTRQQTQGTVHSDAETPRSSPWINTPSGRHLKIVPDTVVPSPPPNFVRYPIMTRSKTKDPHLR